MKIVKKFIFGLFAYVSVSALALGLTGCEEEHVHSYTDYVTAPTCTEKGYTTHTCTCGDTVVDAYVDELGHDFKDYVSDKNATYDSDGTKTAICTRENCEEKDTVTEENTKLESKISFKTLIADGLAVYGKVSNATETFSFIDEIATFGEARFIVSLDIYGTQQVTTKTIPLMVGDNTVYITEMIDDEPINVYSVTVRRRPVYQVVFNADDGSEMQNQMVEEDGFASIPSDVEKLGYRFAGWDYDFDTPISQKTMINAVWETKEEMQNFHFSSTATTCSITGINDKTVTEIVVPEYVTSISSGAFSGCSALESITLPFVGDSIKTASDAYQYPFGYIFGTSSYGGGTATEQYYYGSSTSFSTYDTYYIPTSLKSVTVTGGNILYGAFYNCDSLTSVTIGNSVTSIGSSAFRYCDRLTSVTIPDSVTSIGNSAFDSSGLKNIIVSTNNTVYKSMEGNLYTKDGTMLIQYARGKTATSFAIPDGVTSIGNYAFDGCSNLTSITIPDSVTSIGYGAFV